jgi:hypothetical protein
MTEKTDEDKSVLIRMRVSPRLHAYLGLLARKTLLGTAENDVAEYLLTQRLEVMLAEKYHEKQAVPD